MDIVDKIHTPEDPAWTVWADALLDRGDPRGELITLERMPQVALRPDQLERLEELRRPYIERFKTNAQGLLPGGWLTREVTRWHFGYALALDCTEPLLYPPDTLVARLSRLLDSEELSCLSSLRVELTGRQVMPMLEALVRHHPPLIELGLRTDFGVSEAQNWARLWAALPSLERVTFSSMAIPPNLVSHPNLRSVSLLPPGGTTSKALIALADAELPALERLECFGDPYTQDWLGDALERAPVRALFERLEVFECAVLLPIASEIDQLPTQLQPLQRLPEGLRVVCVLDDDPEQREEVCRLLPQLNFDFHDEADRMIPFFGGRSRDLDLVTRGQDSDQERLSIGPWVYIGRMLGRERPERSVAQRELADELLRVLDAGGEFDVETERLYELLRAEARSVLQQLRGRRRTLRLTLEQRPSSD